MQAPTAQARAAHAAGESTFARPQPSRPDRSVVAAASGSSATASRARIGDAQRHRPGTRAGGGGGAGLRDPPRGAGGTDARPGGTRGISTVAGSPPPPDREACAAFAAAAGADRTTAAAAGAGRTTAVPPSGPLPDPRGVPSPGWRSPAGRVPVVVTVAPPVGPGRGPG